LIANVNRDAKKYPKGFTAANFFPALGKATIAEPEGPMEPNQMLDFLMAWGGARGAHVREQ